MFSNVFELTEPNARVGTYRHGFRPSTCDHRILLGSRKQVRRSHTPRAYVITIAGLGKDGDKHRPNCQLSAGLCQGCVLQNGVDVRLKFTLHPMPHMIKVDSHPFAACEFECGYHIAVARDDNNDVY